MRSTQTTARTATVRTTPPVWTGSTPMCVCAHQTTQVSPDARARVAVCRLWLVVRSKSTTFLASSKNSTSCPPLDKVLNPTTWYCVMRGFPEALSLLACLPSATPHPTPCKSLAPPHFEQFPRALSAVCSFGSCSSPPSGTLEPWWCLKPAQRHLHCGHAPFGSELTVGRWARVEGAEETRIKAVSRLRLPWTGVQFWLVVLCS